MRIGGRVLKGRFPAGLKFLTVLYCTLQSVAPIDESGPIDRSHE
jgi:hypothetical protein